MGASQENRVGLKFKKNAAMAAERLRSHKVITEPMSKEAFMDGNDEIEFVDWDALTLSLSRGERGCELALATRRTAIPSPTGRGVG